MIIPKFINNIIIFYQKQTLILNNYGSDFLLLTIRIWIGLIFWKAGIIKINDFDTTIDIFTDEYMIPFFPPIFIAFMATFFEIVCSILIFLGFFTRLASIPFIIMSIVIQILVFSHNDHFYWIFLLSTLLIYGGGRISADYIILKKIEKLKLFTNDKK
jgi:putative oxidoreductase